MKTDEIRESFLSFFSKKGHRVVASDSLIPQNDPTLLFTGAGMNQFKEYFLGLKKDMRRAASSQKCLRTGDLDEVGRTAFHHSFFEMLGNFSFGDYFKKEAITWAWEYLTAELKIPRERLRVSVHESDSEAFQIWRDDIKVPENRIYRLGDRSNFWPANAPQDGPNGPCGPCSEIYFDTGDDPAKPSEHLDAPRFAEIWNLVFTQFDRQEGGRLAPLASKNIDTGMGLERIACVIQGKKTNFDIDIFLPMHEAVKQCLRFHDSEPPRNHLNAISDHARAILFAMADGAIPSNEGRGYVIRKLIRRALWHAQQIVPGARLSEAFLYRVIPAVVAVMKKAYPEIPEAEASVSATLRAEEERFLDTLDTGLRILENRLTTLSSEGAHVVPGDVAFELYDTYGFPEELTRTIAESKGFSVDRRGFEENMQRQRDRAKESTQIAAAIFVTTEWEKQLAGLTPSRFLGYETLEGKGKVLFANIRDGKGIVVLDQTPFYGESGGQVGDQGILENSDFRASVVNTQKKDALILHAVEVKKGQIKAGAEVKALVDAERRFRIMANHTATHLLHAALRRILGTQVRQMGSLVSPEKLRFDYSWSQALTHEQLRKIEDDVNRQVLRNAPVRKEDKDIQDAKADGAIAFFGEKYSDRVRVITVPDYSMELCGGTHCDQTGQIGSFLILSDSSVASGTRRIEAVTGYGALDYIHALRTELQQIADMLKTSPMGVSERVMKLQVQHKKLEKEIKHARPTSANPKHILAKARQAGDVRFVAYRFETEVNPQEIRKLSDEIRTTAINTVYFLGAESKDKIHFIVGLSPDLAKTPVDAREISNELAAVLQAGGGGRKDLVQGGARNVGQFEKDWETIVEKSLQYLQRKEI